MVAVGPPHRGGVLEAAGDGGGDGADPSAKGTEGSPYGGSSAARFTLLSPGTPPAGHLKMDLGQHLKPVSPKLSPRHAVSLPALPPPGAHSLGSPSLLGHLGPVPAVAQRQHPQPSPQHARTSPSPRAPTLQHPRSDPVCTDRQTFHLCPHQLSSSRQQPPMQFLATWQPSFTALSEGVAQLSALPSHSPMHQP